MPGWKLLTEDQLCQETEQATPAPTLYHGDFGSSIARGTLLAFCLKSRELSLPLRLEQGRVPFSECGNITP